MRRNTDFFAQGGSANDPAGCRLNGALLPDGAGLKDVWGRQSDQSGQSSNVVSHGHSRS